MKYGQLEESLRKQLRRMQRQDVHSMKPCVRSFYRDHYGRMRRRPRRARRSISFERFFRLTTRRTFTSPSEFINDARKRVRLWVAKTLSHARSFDYPRST